MKADLLIFRAFHNIWRFADSNYEVFSGDGKKTVRILIYIRKKSQGGLSKFSKEGVYALISNSRGIFLF